MGQRVTRTWLRLGGRFVLVILSLALMPPALGSVVRNSQSVAISRFLLSGEGGHLLGPIKAHNLECQRSNPCLLTATYFLHQRDYDSAQQILLGLTTSGSHQQNLAWFRLGQIQAAEGKVEEAVASWRKAAANPYFENQGILAYGNGEHEKAVEWLELSLAINPTDGIAHRELGKALLALGQREEALVHLQRSLEYVELDWNTYMYIGDTHFRLGEYRPAIAALNFAADLNPSAPRPYLLLARTSSALGRHEDALNYMRKAVELAAGRANAPAYRWRLAEMLFESGRVSEAIQQGEDALSAKDDSARRHTLNCWRSALEAK